MRLELTRSGGFAGVVRRASLDTADLPAAEAAKWEALVADALDAPHRGDSGPDRFGYQLTVDGTVHTWGEPTDGPRAELVARLLRRS